jgi:hypothetical protein
VDAQANGLIDLEFKKGETIALWMKDGAEKVRLYATLSH